MKQYPDRFYKIEKFCIKIILKMKLNLVLNAALMKNYDFAEQIDYKKLVPIFHTI